MVSELVVVQYNLNSRKNMMRRVWKLNIRPVKDDMFQITKIKILSRFEYESCQKIDRSDLEIWRGSKYYRQSRYLLGDEIIPGRYDYISAKSLTTAIVLGAG